MRIDLEATRKARAEWATRHGLDPARIINEAPDVDWTYEGVGIFRLREVVSDQPFEWREVTVRSTEPFPPDLIPKS